MVCKKYSLDGLSYLKCKGKYKIQGLQKQSASFSKLKKIFLGYSLIICILLENDYGAGRLDYRRVSGAAKCYGQSRRNILKMGHEMVHFLSTFKGHTQKWKRGGGEILKMLRLPQGSPKGRVCVGMGKILKNRPSQMRFQTTFFHYCCCFNRLENAAFIGLIC